MLEATTKRGNVASVIADLEKRHKMDFSTNVETNRFRSRDRKTDNFNVGGSNCSDGQEKESETDSEKEPCCEAEGGKNCFLNTIREEKETGSETSTKKLCGGDDSSPEESTVKQTWSGSASPGLFTSGSDFSSSEYEEEETEGRKEIGCGARRGREKNKRNSITKDCNSDFHWVISEKQSESTSLCEGEQKTGQKTKPEKFANLYGDERKSSESVLFYPTDRIRKPDYTIADTIIDPSVQLRLPPQSPGSLDRKRLTKTRLERDQKCKSSIVTRSPQSTRKIQTKSLGDGISFTSDGKKRDYFYQQDGWHQCLNDENEKCCQHYKSVCAGHGCCGNYCTCYHHHPFPWQPQCRTNNFGSCESLQEKMSRKNGFGSQRTLYDDRSQRKFLWQDSQQRLLHGSNECLTGHCCERDKAYPWRYLGKTGPEFEERLIRLENDKESLQLQVSVLTEQVEAQSEKIADLQQSLDDKKQQLSNTEDLLQREILTRSSLETQKLELMSAISELKLHQSAVERENYELKEEKKRYQNVKPPMIPRNTSPALLQSTPICSNRISPTDYQNPRKSSNPYSGQDLSSTTSQPNSFSDSHHKYLISSTPNNKPLSSISNPVMGMDHHQKDIINFFSSSPQPSLRSSTDNYSSLPRQKVLGNQEMSRLAEATGRNNASGKGLTSLITLKTEKSYSAPNLAETEKQIEDQSDSNQNEIAPSKPEESTQSQQGTTSRKGIKKLFNKIKRSNSGNVNDLLGDGDFKRGRTRATMGPRIGASVSPGYRPPDKPFAEWDTESLCGWLEELSLENYVADFRRWIKSGSQLLSASPNEIEKELGMKNHLHKKKLLLALQEMSEKSAECDELLKPAGCLDTAWVLRWLDDVGLPQHKEVFLTARVDGRMLHRLTMEDLATMHITSALHVASLKKGIKVLREYKMDPNCLTRRSIPDEPPPTATDVALWTNHRVMEWLRVVDLAEYAPNLRGSGVHGALMVYETKFTAELLASLLNIPPNKTLLRRHLNTHFKELLGREVIQAKREAETTLGYIPLTPSAKVKAIKKPQFTLKRKKNKHDIDFGDLICPLDDGASGENSFPTNACLSSNGGGFGVMKEKRHVPDVCPLTESSPRSSPSETRMMRI